MFKTLLTLFCCVALVLPACAQEINSRRENPSTYFNGFQNSHNIDSSLTYARSLAANPMYSLMLTELMHNAFAQQFIKPDSTASVDQIAAAAKGRAFSQTLLTRMMADTSKALVKNLRPIYYWQQVANHENDLKAASIYAQKFIDEELTGQDLYKDYAGRYDLLIRQILDRHTETKPQATQIFSLVKAALKQNQVLANPDTASRLLLDKRAWYRYVYAYCNYLDGEALIKAGKVAEAGAPLKLAFDYSPDLADNNHNYAYFYDMVFLTGGTNKSTFRPVYANYLAAYSRDKKQTLDALLTIALNDPSLKKELKSYYEANFAQATPFNTYWLNSINARAGTAIPFRLMSMNGSEFASLSHKGKWVLLDFWGTWCGPCREEHPALNKFYNNTVSKSDKLAVLTIACRDTEDKVNDYMAEYHYSFPVAMANNSIINTYHVQGYPTKILITPQGKYVTVPFGVDWVTFIKNYADI